jgi:PEP-CTERM motif-containing protein
LLLKNSAGNTNGDGGTFSIIIDGTTVATDALGAIGAHTTLMDSLDELVSLSAGTHTIETEITRAFQSTAVGDPTPNEYVDNISLIATPTPEPSSFVLFGTGILVLAGAVRRRFNQRS